MQGPAPVSLEAAGDAGAWRAGVAVLHAATAAALLAWAPGWATASLALAVTAAGAAHWRAQARRSPQRLRWDGQGWWLGERSVHPRVALDVGGWMLLRLHPAGAAGAAGAAGVAPGWPVAAAAWLPLSASRAGSAWPALRVALFATLDGAAAGTGEVPA